MILYKQSITLFWSFQLIPFFPGRGPATNAPLPSRGMFRQQSFSTMGCGEKFLLAMPPRHSAENFLEAYEVVLILDDRETLGR